VSASTFGEFIAMGGYALYVWGSLAMCAAALVWEVATLLQRRHHALGALRDDVREAAAAGARR